jgi:hypothetical protein
MLLAEAKDIRVGTMPAKAAYAGAVKDWPTAVAPPFSPKDILGLFSWLDAMQILDVQDGGPVLAWVDASGNGQNAYKIGNDSAYHAAGINGKPSVRFCEFGTLTGMRLDLNRALGDRTIFLVVQTMGPAIGQWHSVQVQEFDPYVQTYGNPTVHTYASPDLDSGVAFSGVCQFITLWVDSTLHQQWLEVDGHQVTTSYNPAATSSTSSIFVGGFPPGGYAMNGYIGDLLIYERALTLTERDDVQGYLEAKWAA